MRAVAAWNKNSIPNNINSNNRQLNRMKKRFYGISRQIYLATMRAGVRKWKCTENEHITLHVDAFQIRFLLNPYLAWCRFFVCALDGCTLWLSVNSEKDRQMTRQSGRARVTLMIMYVSANGWCINTYGLRFEWSICGFFCSLSESHVAYALFSTKTNEQSKHRQRTKNNRSHPNELRWKRKRPFFCVCC